MKVCSLCRRCHDDSVASCTEGHPPLSESRTGSCELVPGYRLEQQLDSGLKGETYRAREKMSGKTCLIRLFPPNEANREQFLYEARLAATLFHPNVADIYEADALPTGELYVVSEDPEGQTARELLQSSGTPRLLAAIQIVRQAAEAVHALHLKGLIHRAVNPENIVVTTDPAGDLSVRIQNPDFGGIAERSIVSNKFLIDTAINSVRYFAPEQCSGEPENIKTDIYALGVVLYEMIAGVPPFDAPKAAALIQMHRSLPPPEVRIDNFDLRMLLTHTLMESLQKQPRTRQSSANAFARQLRHMEQLATHVSTPPPAGVVPTPPPRSTTVNAGFAAAVKSAAVAPPASAVMNVPVIPKPTVDQSYVEAVQPVVNRVDSEPAPPRHEPVRPPVVDTDPVAPVPMVVTAADPLPAIAESEQPLTETIFETTPTVAKHLEGPLDDIPDMPESLADIVQFEDVTEDVTFIPIDPAEDEMREIEPPQAEVLSIPVFEAPAAEVAQPEFPTVKAAQAEVELPEIPDTPVESPVAVPILARAEPTKIVWDDLEDDIPSEEDVQAVLLEEQRSEPAESSTPEPFQIEVEPPEVPILQAEPQRTETPPAAPIHAKVVWEDLDDDLPSEEDVQAALLADQLPPNEEQLPQLVSEERPHWSVVEETVPEPVAEPIIREPVPVEPELPEILAVHPEPPKIETEPLRPAPAKVVFEGLDDDLPSEADVQAAMLEELPTNTADVPLPEPPASQQFLFGQRVQPSIAPNVEIVSEPRNVERRKPTYRPPEDPIFASYSGRSMPSVNINYRSVLVVVGFLTMGVVFFVGRVVMSDSFAGQGPVKKVEAETVSSQLPPAQAPQQIAAAQKKEPDLKPLDTATADDELNAGQLKPLTTDEKASSPRQMFYPTPTTKSVSRDETVRAAVVTPTAQSQPSNTTVSQNTAKPLPFATSVVIPYKGRQKEKVQNEKDCADQQAPADQNRTSPNRAVNITRPRVVRDPKN